MMNRRPEIHEVREHLLVVLRNSVVHASTRFALAEDLTDRYPALDRDEARLLVHRALASMQAAGEVAVLPSESWDYSGDERVRLIVTE